MSSEIYKLLGEVELYDLDKFTDELFVFLQESDNVGAFSVDFNKERVEDLGWIQIL